MRCDVHRRWRGQGGRRGRGCAAQPRAGGSPVRRARQLRLAAGRLQRCHGSRGACAASRSAAAPSMGPHARRMRPAAATERPCMAPPPRTPPPCSQRHLKRGDFLWELVASAAPSKDRDAPAARRFVHGSCPAHGRVPSAAPACRAAVHTPPVTPRLLGHSRLCRRPRAQPLGPLPRQAVAAGRLALRHRGRPHPRRPVRCASRVSQGCVEGSSAVAAAAGSRRAGAGRGALACRRWPRPEPRAQAGRSSSACGRCSCGRCCCARRCSR
jgi:hypothetical protein